MTRNMEISVPRHRHSPMPTMAGSVVIWAMRNPAEDRILPEVSTVGEGQIQRLDDGVRRDISAFSSLYQEEITMA